jgi:hypothetical protein
MTSRSRSWLGVLLLAALVAQCVLPAWHVAAERPHHDEFDDVEDDDFDDVAVIEGTPDVASGSPDAPADHVHTDHEVCMCMCAW